MIENQNKKRICIAIHGLYRAGAERVAASWANYLTAHGHQVSIVMYACNKESHDLDERVRQVPLADSTKDYYRLPKLKQLSLIRRAVRQENPDVLISFLPKMQVSMMLATIGMKIKRIETIRNNPWMDADVASGRFLWNLCFHRSDLIFVQTKEQSLYFSKRLQKKCVVISNPISEEFVSRKPKTYDGNHISRFLAVARLFKQKNYPMMIRAFAKAVQQNPDCTLDIYGAGSPEQVQELQGLIQQLGMENQIHLCGWTKDISVLLPQYDAFLMSSDYEGMPNALAEAMTVGLVCLSTDCKTGPKDMIDSGKNGFLAKTGDVDSFAAGIEKMIAMDPQQCADMGRLARASILEMCSEENTLARLKQQIETNF